MSKNLKKIVFAIVLIALIAGIFLFSAKNANLEDELYDFKIYFFKGGKADCILISNNDKNILIDTGKESLSKEVLSYFANHNITKLDYLILSNFEEEHVGGAAEIINNINVINVFQSNGTKESESYANYMNALSNKGITAQTISGGHTFALGDIKFTVNGSESNNSSLIVKVNYKGQNYLFMGDSQNDRIEEYIGKNNGKVDFIKIPDHGTFKENLEDLLKIAEPKYAVITCSKKEPDTSKTEKLLTELGIKYYSTKNGSVTVLSDGNELVVKQ